MDVVHYEHQFLYKDTNMLGIELVNKSVCLQICIIVQKLVYIRGYCMSYTRIWTSKQNRIQICQPGSDSRSQHFFSKT
jgi:hypothetical protein